MERRIGALVHFFHFHCADRVLHDEHRVIGRAEGFLLGLRQRIEGVGDERDREAAALLNLDGVVDTPRRARSSIAQAGEDDIRLSR